MLKLKNRYLLPFTLTIFICCGKGYGQEFETLMNTDTMKEMSYLAVNYNKTNHSNGVDRKRFKHLKAWIKSIKQLSYQVNADSTKGALLVGTDSYLMRFNRKKAVTEMILYRTENQIQSINHYHNYRAYLRKSWQIFNKKNEIHEAYYYTYDANNLLSIKKSIIKGKQEEAVFKIEQKEDTIIHYLKNTTDKYIDGKIVESKNNRSDYVTFYEYSKDKLVLIKILNGDKVTSLSRFDAEENLIHFELITYIDEAIDSKYIHKYTYNENNQKLSHHNIAFQKDKIILDKKYKFQYSVDRQLEKIIQYDDNSQKIVGENKYNSHGWLVSEYFNYIAPEEIRYTNFDENGNWQRLESYSGGKLYMISEREIEYFK